MGIECGERLLEVGRGFDLRGAELDPPRFVVEMDAQDLGGLARWQVGRLGFRHNAPVADQEAIAGGSDPFGLTLMQDSSPFHSWSVENAHVCYLRGDLMGDRDQAKEPFLAAMFFTSQ